MCELAGRQHDLALRARFGGGAVLPSRGQRLGPFYPFKIESVEQLKAHVFSGNNKGQCIEVHMSRLGASEQQRQAWFAGFAASQ